MSLHIKQRSSRKSTGSHQGKILAATYIVANQPKPKVGTHHSVKKWDLWGTKVNTFPCNYGHYSQRLLEGQQ